MHVPLTDETIRHLASREMRMAHYLWHRSREVWARLTPDQRSSFETKFGWSPRPSLDEDGTVIYDHPGPGRDFLYMHRVMICHVDAMQRASGGAPTRGFSKLPPTGDTTYPVPPRPPSLGGKQDRKWTDYILDFNDKFNGGFFETLSQLGAYVEYGVHALMHERFCEAPEFERPEPPVGGDWPLPEARWDDPGYAYLYDMYAAHVNPCFWSIHGWIDGLIETWAASSKQPVDWTGAWLGPMEDLHGPGHPHQPHHPHHPHHPHPPREPDEPRCRDLVSRPHTIAPPVVRPAAERLAGLEEAAKFLGGIDAPTPFKVRVILTP